jgi:hypothetical protein
VAVVDNSTPIEVATIPVQSTRIAAPLTSHRPVVALVAVATLIQAPPQLHPNVGLQLVDRVLLSNERGVGGGDGLGYLLTVPSDSPP